MDGRREKRRGEGRRSKPERRKKKKRRDIYTARKRERELL